MQENVTRTSTAMIILPCPVCARSVKVLGRVTRVLCACGEILMEVAPEKPAPPGPGGLPGEGLGAG